MAGDPIISIVKREGEKEKKKDFLRYLEPFVALFIGNFHMVTCSRIQGLRN